MGRILELARSRRSIRSYSCDPVPLEDVAYIVDVARHAPSGANKQPWRFLVVRDPLVKRLIRGKCEEVERRFHERVDPEFREWLRSRGISWRKPFLTDAPILILVFARRGEPYWIESTWISIGYLILAAEELGYSTLTYTPSEVDWSNKILQVPEEYVLQAIIPVGKPAERREAREQDRRLSLHEVCYLDSWGKGLEI